MNCDVDKSAKVVVRALCSLVRLLYLRRLLSVEFGQNLLLLQQLVLHWLRVQGRALPLLLDGVPFRHEVSMLATR